MNGRTLNRQHNLVEVWAVLESHELSVPSNIQPKAKKKPKKNNLGDRPMGTGDLSQESLLQAPRNALSRRD